MRLLPLTLVLFLSLGCARFATYALQPTTGLVTRPEADAHVCVVRGLMARGYLIESDSGSILTARYGRGRNSLRISVEIGPQTYVVRHLESEGYGYGRDGNSEHVGRNYNRAMDALHLTIQREMSRPSAPTGPVDSDRAVSSGGQTVIVLQLAPGGGNGGGNGGGGGGGNSWQGMTCAQVVQAHGLGTFEQHARCRPTTNAGCADAVLSAGRPSTDIFFCDNIRDTGCARAHLLGGGSGVGLGRCH